MEASFGPCHIVFLIFKNACFTQNNVPTSSALDPDVLGLKDPDTALFVQILPSSSKKSKKKPLIFTV
jgi:hypothetical protein